MFDFVNERLFRRKMHALYWGNCPKTSKQHVRLSFNFTAYFDLNKYIDRAWKLRIDKNTLGRICRRADWSRKETYSEAKCWVDWEENERCGWTVHESFDNTSPIYHVLNKIKK